MELSRKMQDALNEQIKEEMASAYIYLSMAAYCESINLPGFAHWMQNQSQEELSHAMKLYEYIHDRGGRVVFQALEQPPAEFDGPIGVFEKTLAHEQYITGRIHNLYAMAAGENDYASLGILQWFVNEQVEEEKTAGDILNLLKMVGDKGQGLIILDRQLASRG
ncbi:MAG TPA: ferritin [Anaerolineae bacterium]|nr:ferritin [Anaerolineae bacterium]